MKYLISAVFWGVLYIITYPFAKLYDINAWLLKRLRKDPYQISSFISLHYQWLLDKLKESSLSSFLNVETWDYGCSYNFYIRFSDGELKYLKVFEVARPDINSKGYDLNRDTHKDKIVSNFINYCKEKGNYISEERYQRTI